MARPLTYGALIFPSALFIAPFLWTLLTAVKSEAELVTWPPVFWPEEWRWANFAESWAKQPFGIYLRNSMTVVVLSTIGQVFSSSLVAFGFARFRFRGRDPLFVLLLATMMIPWDVKMIPLYMEFNLLCLIPEFDGALFSLEWKEGLWARFFTAAPPRQRQSVEQYRIVKRA